jgi:hypothetical protein
MAGGVSVAQQALAAGLADEAVLHVDRNGTGRSGSAGPGALASLV